GTTYVYQQMYTIKANSHRLEKSVEGTTGVHCICMYFYRRYYIIIYYHYTDIGSGPTTVILLLDCSIKAIVKADRERFGMHIIYLEKKEILGFIAPASSSAL
ncbi:hypothetical protein ACJX0J_029304, partial [Zea mays]